MLLDFMANTPNVSQIINFSTTPDWMWVTDTPYEYPGDVNTIDWNYNNGTQLRDPFAERNFRVLCKNALLVRKGRIH